MIYNVSDWETTAPHQDLLQLPTVKAKIMEKLALTETEYALRFVPDRFGNKQGVTLIFDCVFDEANKISINNSIYNAALMDVVYSSGGQVSLFSLKVQSAGSGQLNFIVM